MYESKVWSLFVVGKISCCYSIPLKYILLTLKKEILRETWVKINSIDKVFCLKKKTWTKFHLHTKKRRKKSILTYRHRLKYIISILKNTKRKGENYGFDWLGFVKIIFNFILKKFSLFRTCVFWVFLSLWPIDTNWWCKLGEVLLHVGQDEQFLLLINSIIITVKRDLNTTCFSWKYHKMPINWATKLFINMIDLSVKSHKLGLVEAWWALGSLGYAWYLDWVDWSGSWLGLGYGSLFGTALGGFNKMILWGL